ncbi:MAG: hypothetical protein V5A39_07370 [Haloarculaceae archaeon]
MSSRTALKQSKILTFAVLAAFVWLLFGLLRVATAFNWYEFSGAADFLGRNAVGGIVGVLVLVVLLSVLVVLYSELSSADPTPDTWPPSE